MSQDYDALPDREGLREAWNRRYRITPRVWGNAPELIQEFPPSGFVLELGVGDGKNLRSADLRNTTCIGLDSSEEAIRICSRDPTLSLAVLVVADACSLPFRQNSVSKILAHHILGHIPSSSILCFMDEVFRVLQPGGTVSVTVFAKGDMRDGSGVEVEPSAYLRGDGILTRYYSHEDLLQLGGRFHPSGIEYSEWVLPIRGKQYLRREITGQFVKPAEIF